MYLVDISVQKSSTQWDALNATVQGRLIRGIPFARPCFRLSNQISGSFDAGECSVVIQDYLNECIVFLFIHVFTHVYSHLFSSQSRSGRHFLCIYERQSHFTLRPLDPTITTSGCLQRHNGRRVKRGGVNVFSMPRCLAIQMHSTLRMSAVRVAFQSTECANHRLSRTTIRTY